MGVAATLVGKEDINDIAVLLTDRLHRTLHEVSTFDFESFAKLDTENYIKALEEQEQGGDSNVNASEQ
jgi:hypothetical protein